MNPYHHELWDYNIGVAEELVKLGFGEIQFDYIRFPEPYASLPKQGFPDSQDVTKPNALAEYLKEAKTRLNKLGVRSTADIFGLVTTVNGALEVGQEWEKLAPNTDVLLPMVYPSHYPHGSFGINSPNAEPYQDDGDKRARGSATRSWDQEARTRASLAAGVHAGSRRTAPRLRAEKKAVYDSGYDGWVMWNPDRATTSTCRRSRRR